MTMLNNVINCIAIDDDLSALRIIREYCSRVQTVNLSGTFSNPFEAVPVLNNNQIDLIFLDIVMPQISGLEFLKTLYNPPLIIFTTAFREYAVEGFEHNAVDYLIKPIPYDRFCRSVNKASQFIRLKKQIIVPGGENTPEMSHGFLMVKVEYSTIRINLSDILYIEGLKDYAKIYTEGRLILTKTTMKNILEKLPSGNFLRVHKSYIISIDKIDMIENSRIVIGNQRIPIGESFRSSFFERVNRNLL
jgi:DNA-binding LytR/AlgR family response regulator